MKQKDANSPFLYDSTTGRIVGIKQPDGSEMTFADNDVIAAALALKAPLADPAFTGDVTAEKISPTLLGLPEKTPVNAVAAAKILTFTGNAADNETVTIGATTYTFQSAIGSATAASGTLTVSDTPHEGETVVIGAKTYKWRAAIGAGAKATGTLSVADVPHNTGSVTINDTTYTFVTALTEAKAVSTLTLSANATDGNSVTIGSTKYTFKETLAAAYDVLIGASASDTIDNLIAAINKATGEGSTYGTGTVAHPSVTAAIGAGDTMDITAKVAGVAGNSIATTELSAVCTWTSTVMGSGVDPVANEILIGASAEASIDNLVAAANGTAGAGTTYATGSTVHATCDIAKATAGTMTATAKSVGFAGNAYASTVGGTTDHLSWDGGVVLAGGVDAQAANDILIGENAEAAIDNMVLAITGGAGAGTNYGTGTTASTQVTAVKASAATMTVTALAAGDAGNAIATTTTATHCGFGGAKLSGGESAQAANDVLIGADAQASIDNLVAAVNKAVGEGTTYGTGTVANASCSAVKADTDKLVATARTKGAAGNSIVIGKTVAKATWASGAVVLSGGVDGTVGVANETCADATNLYHCIAANTIADANWRKVSLGSAY
jgi:hypothetical protein